MRRSKQKQTKQNLNRYAGKWVAMVEGQVVESADSLPELMAEIEEKEMTEKVSVLLVPRKDEGPYILPSSPCRSTCSTAIIFSKNSSLRSTRKEN